MKTARELLLERHRTARPKLDEIRRNVVTEFCRPRRSWTDALAAWCEEIIRLPRPALAGLGAAWIAIIALNFSSETPHTDAVIARSPARPSPETLQALREQKRLFAEMVGSAGSDAESPRLIPRPRSERSTSVAMA